MFVGLHGINFFRPSGDPIPPPPPPGVTTLNETLVVTVTSNMHYPSVRKVKSLDASQLQQADLVRDERYCLPHVESCLTRARR
jgi:hypothetical protein